MIRYLIYAIGPNGHFREMWEIMAVGDEAAVERARQMLDRYDLEVWCGGEKIATLSAKKALNRHARCIAPIYPPW
jgi:hypothetical protein